MKRLSKLSALLVSALLFATVLASCAPPAANSPAAAGDTSGGTAAADGASTGSKILRLSQRSEAETIDPQLANSMPAQNSIAPLVINLLRNNAGTLEPDAAESYEMSEDGLTYTFKLRDGLVWSDGQPLNAKDFEYGIQRLLDPAVASKFSFLGMLIKNAAAVNAGEVPVEELGVKALDDLTLEITLENPAAYFPGMLGSTHFAPARRDLVEQYGNDFASSAETNVYSGPFVLKEYRQNDRFVYEKNPNYWNADAVKLDGAEILTVTDANTAFGMYEAGELDFVEIPTSQASQYPDASYYANGNNDYVKLNVREGYPTSNKNLRLALAYGLNRQDYITLATSGVYAPNLRFVLPEVNGVEDKYGTEYPLEFFPLNGDMAKAKEHLDKAVTELGVASPTDIELELLCSDTDISRTECEVLQSQWQTNLGIKVNIRQVAYKQRLEMENNGEFTMVATGWVPDYSDPLSYLELWTSTSNQNHGGYNSPEYDAAIAASISETDPKARMDLLFEAEQIMLGDAILIPYQLRQVPYLINPNVENLLLYFVNTAYNFAYADIKG